MYGSRLEHFYNSYLSSFFAVVVTMSTVGYGARVVKLLDTNWVFARYFLQFSGVLFYGWLTNSLSHIMNLVANIRNDSGSCETFENMLIKVERRGVDFKSKVVERFRMAHDWNQMWNLSQMFCGLNYNIFQDRQSHKDMNDMILISYLEQFSVFFKSFTCDEGFDMIRHIQPRIMH